MFENRRALSAFGAAVDYEEMMMPEGVKLSPELIHALSNLPIDMGLKTIGFFTPWAKRESDFSWKSLENPVDNFKLYAMESAQIAVALEKLFNQPLPFVGIVSATPLTSTEVASAIEGSEYELYETYAVYNQEDKSPTPAINYFYWLAMGPEGDKPDKTMGDVAKLLKGQLVLPARVPYLSTSSRAFPAMSFEQSNNTQLTEISAEDIKSFENPQVVPTKQQATVASSGPPLFAMLVVSAVVAAVTIKVGKAIAK